MMTMLMVISFDLDDRGVALRCQARPPDSLRFLPIRAFRLSDLAIRESCGPMETQLNELRALASRAENRRTETGIPRVAMVQGAIPEHQLAAVYDPMINLILTGSKTMTVGERTFRYDPATYFVMSVDLPAVGAVHPAASGEPYLAVSLTLTPAIVTNLLADLPKPVGGAVYGPGFSVAAVTPELLDAWVRMMRLIERPDEVAALAPPFDAPYRALPDRGRDPVDTEELRQTAPRGGAGRDGGAQRLCLPPPLQGRHRAKPAAIPKERPPAARTIAADRRRRQRHDRRPQRRLRESNAVQP
jgi:hypothetical protein